MKKLFVISACLSVFFLSSCRHEQADELFEETQATGNVFLDGNEMARDSTASQQAPILDNEPPIPPRK